MKLKFERDPDRRWYVVLPEWPGDRAALEMVLGADELLEILGGHRAEVEVEFSLELEDDCFTSLELYDSDESGGYYHVHQYGEKSFDIWLCNVTLFVFQSSEFPKYIYIK